MKTIRTQNGYERPIFHYVGSYSFSSFSSIVHWANVQCSNVQPLDKFIFIYFFFFRIKRFKDLSLSFWVNQLDFHLSWRSTKKIYLMKLHTLYAESAYPTPNTIHYPLSRRNTAKCLYVYFCRGKKAQTHTHTTG